jgi:hypothetical protein
MELPGLAISESRASTKQKAGISRFEAFSTISS